MVTPNQLAWWIDAAGILHSAPHLPHQTNPAQRFYAQGLIDPAARTGTITHIDNRPATLAVTPRELFDILDQRFPHTRWWIYDCTDQTTPHAPRPIPAHF